MAPAPNKQTAGADEPKRNSGGHVFQLFDPSPSHIIFQILVLTELGTWQAALQADVQDVDVLTNLDIDSLLQRALHNISNSHFSSKIIFYKS